MIMPDWKNMQDKDHRHSQYDNDEPQYLLELLEQEAEMEDGISSEERFEAEAYRHNPDFKERDEEQMELLRRSPTPSWHHNRRYRQNSILNQPQSDAVTQDDLAHAMLVTYFEAQVPHTHNKKVNEAYQGP